MHVGDIPFLLVGGVSALTRTILPMRRSHTSFLLSLFAWAVFNPFITAQLGIPHPSHTICLHPRVPMNKHITSSSPGQATDVNDSATGVSGEASPGDIPPDAGAGEASTPTPVVAPPLAVLAWPDFLEKLGLGETSNTMSTKYEFDFLATEGCPSTSAGYLNYLNQDVGNQRAVCQQHIGCVCWIRIAKRIRAPGCEFELLRIMAEWLSMKCDRATHMEASVHLKVSWGMAPK